MEEREKIRIDKYLWSIRIFKTRRIATDACNSGKVKSNGINVKPAKPVSIGDEYEIKIEAKKWIIKVTGLLHTRMSFEIASQNYLDLSPEQEVSKQSSAFVFNTGKRQSKKGRPTKKEKRKLDDFLE